MSWLKKILPYLTLAATLAGLQILLKLAGREFWLTQLTMALYCTIVVLGLCLLMGFAGQVSLGHAAFFAMGGYTAAWFTTHNFAPLQDTLWVKTLQALGLLHQRMDLYNNPILTGQPWAGCVLALGLTALVALIIGYPALRLRGHYLAMATLGFGLIVSKIIIGSSALGASDGLTNVPPWTMPGGLTLGRRPELRVQNYYLAGGVLLLALLVLRNWVHSRVGRALQAIHDRETAANAAGIDTAQYKLKTFVASALLAALAGVFYTHYTGGISPSKAGALESVRYVALAAAGGMSSLWGVTTMSTALNFCSFRGWFGSLDHAVFGAVLILIVSLAPEGPLRPLSEWAARWRAKMLRRKEAPDAAA
ncbi:MAG: branched-chain amino acid ABC transporter permease [Verrucomicrobiae bacterium]|nr:branched-chain amino acid ABC transporter permease [Verrucomicrobiae bacterium]